MIPNLISTRHSSCSSIYDAARKTQTVRVARNRINLTCHVLRIHPIIFNYSSSITQQATPRTNGTNGTRYSSVPSLSLPVYRISIYIPRKKTHPGDKILAQPGDNTSASKKIITAVCVLGRGVLSDAPPVPRQLGRGVLPTAVIPVIWQHAREPRS